jgi:hypothetical protein
MDPTFSFKSKIWLWNGQKGSWHFISLPVDLSKRLKGFDTPRKGFGSIAVKVTIGKTTWKTSVFPDKKSGTYVLPLKKDVRKKETLAEGDKVEVSFTLQ